VKNEKPALEWSGFGKAQTDLRGPLGSRAWMINLRCGSAHAPALWSEYFGT
jgi:hypothetical protein